MSKKKLIVNADDFGQSEGVNKGIITTFELGILTSASLMVRYPAAIAAAEYSIKNNLDLGLHLDLGEWIFSNNEWIPVYEVVSMDNEKVIEEEIVKQLNTFIRMVGRNPTHIDSHQHVHRNKSIRPLFFEIARKLNVALRSFSQNVEYCGDFYGQNSNNTTYHEGISVSNLNRIISTLPEGITELACHPGFNVEFETMYKIEREKEVNSLCDKSVRETIINEDVELCSFSGIPF